jgi:D-glycero-alpha-D-manno-heptose-7-phosphate kinase
MIITRTPFRISFVGGGSDLAGFYREHGGAVLSTSINQYMYISTHKFFEPDKIRVKYAQTETVNAVAELKHPILKEALNMFQLSGGIEISSIADVPAGTGMGSSSSFTVGLLHNLHTLAGNLPDKEQLASEACNIEIERLKEPIGKQDQYAAAYGGLNIIRFNKDDSVRVEKLNISDSTSQALQSNLCMFYFGNQRSASSILSEQKQNTTQADKQRVLIEMVSLVDDLKSVLEKGDLDAFGKILHHNWELKKSLASGISNPDIDDAYELAMKHGALGGKLLGAGGGGFLLFYCDAAKQADLRDALKKLRPFDFSFEYGGSSLIYSDHNL